MRQFILLASAALWLSALSVGAPCTTGTLSSYIALGSAGCTIGTNNLFDFRTLNVTSGATAISTTSVSLTPLGGTLDPGLTAAVSVSASSGNLLETLFTYKISGNSYLSSSITLSGGTETGTGAVGEIENYCAGGVFGSSGITGCTGVAGTLLTLDGIQASDSRSFSAVTILGVTNDLTIDAGPAGSASGGTFTDRFTATSAVPEPFSVTLSALGLSLAIVARKKLTNSKL